jgi:hypothetical protein
MSEGTPSLAGRLAQWLRSMLESIATAEISSRPLGMFRIFVAFILIYQFAGPWVSYQADKFPVAMVTVWVFFVSAFFVLVGFKTRWATTTLALSFAILHLYYGIHHDIYKFSKPVQQFQVVVIMALCPCGRSLSIDRALEVRRAAREGREPEPERMPWWLLELFILQIAVVYLWAAEDKTDDKWFRGERMERYWIEWYGNSDSLGYSKVLHPIAVFLAWSTTILEFTLAFGLPIRRLRPYLLWGGIMLHFGILGGLAVTYFSFMMISILLLCMPPQWIHDFVELLIAGDRALPSQTGGSREK